MRIFRVVVAGGSIAVLHEKQVVLLDVALSPDRERVASCFESGISLEGRSFSADDRWARGSAIAWLMMRSGRCESRAVRSSSSTPARSSRAAVVRGRRLRRRDARGDVELVREADRRELADHLDDLFASRRMTA